MSTLSNTIISQYNSNLQKKEKVNSGSKSTSSHYSTYNSRYIFTLQEDEIKNNKSISNERIESQTEGISLYQFEKNHLSLVKALRSSPNFDSVWKMAQSQVQKEKRNFNLKLNLNFRSYFPLDNFEIGNYLYSNTDDSKKEKKELIIKTESSENISYSNSNLPNLLYFTPKEKKSGKIFILHSSSLKKNNAEISLLSDRSKTTMRKAEEFLDCLSPQNEVNNTLGNYLITDQTLDLNQNIMKREKLIPLSIKFYENKWNRESLICKAENFLIFNTENLKNKKSKIQSEKDKNISTLKNKTNLNFKDFLKCLFAYLIIFSLLIFFLIYLRFKYSMKNILCERNFYLSDNTNNYQNIDKSRQITIYKLSNELQVLNNSGYEIIFHKNLKELGLVEKE